MCAQFYRRRTREGPRRLRVSETLLTLSTEHSDTLRTVSQCPHSSSSASSSSSSLFQCGFFLGTRSTAGRAAIILRYFRETERERAQDERTQLAGRSGQQESCGSQSDLSQPTSDVEEQTLQERPRSRCVQIPVAEAHPIRPLALLARGDAERRVRSQRRAAAQAGARGDRVDVAPSSPAYRGWD